MCNKYNILAYPSFRTFRAGATEPELYQGDSTLPGFRRHVEEIIPACSLEYKELCAAEELPVLEKFAAMSQARRDAKLYKLQRAIAKQQAEHAALETSLQEQTRHSKERREAVVERVLPELKKLRAATPTAK